MGSLNRSPPHKRNRRYNTPVDRVCAAALRSRSHRRRATAMGPARRSATGCISRTTQSHSYLAMAQARPQAGVGASDRSVRNFLTILWRLIKFLPLLLISPLLMLIAIVAIAITDLLGSLRARRILPADQRCSNTSATVVIPSWNGRDLLAKYLPPVVEALSGNPDNEIIVVENASTDGSAEFLREHFPSVKVLVLDRNLGFGGGSNAGFHAARNDIVVVLNSDMRVPPDFLEPLLQPFNDEKVFGVACQIYFTDPAKVREETGLTQGWWENGGLRVRHRDDPAIADAYPCFYGGGGSCAFDRRIVAMAN